MFRLRKHLFATLYHFSGLSDDAMRRSRIERRGPGEYGMLPLITMRFKIFILKYETHVNIKWFIVVWNINQSNYKRD